MNYPNHKKLDTPVWHSLNETHAPFALNYPGLKCYAVDYCPFGGSETIQTFSESIDEYAKLVDEFYIVGEKPLFSTQLELKKELVCIQMIIDKPIDIRIDEEIVQLNYEQVKQVFELVNLVQPGYFKARTILLGDYYGIFKDEMLVAVSGERMKMDDFTEVSAVVTHPAHTGKGYAKQLIAQTVNKIFIQNKTPYLHVAETNRRAIDLYEKLGFETRRKVSFWNLMTSNV